MSTRIPALKIIRLVHLYVGVFISPAILFFALTGALQTFSLHDAAKDGSYTPATWIVQLSQLHKKQTIQLPASKSAAPKASADDDAKTQKKHDGAPKRNTLPMKIFFLVVSIGLFLSTLSGLYMSYTYARNNVTVTIMLFAGILLPVALAML